MIRFIHTADIHFGMENYGKIDTKTGIHTRLLDFEKALNYCIDNAIEQSVDFFLFAGDAYKTHNPSQTQQKLLFKCFLRLYKAGIPIVIVIGNHDHPLSFGKAHALDMLPDLPLEGFHVFSKPGNITLNTKNGPITIVGIPWPTRNTIAIADKHLDKSNDQLTEYISKAVAHIIKDFAQKIDQTIPAILASHITVSTGIFSGSEKRAIYGNDPMLMPSQLAISPFDYVALGHLHRHQNLNASGYPAVVYSGSIERIDFGERKEEKGFCLVSIPEKGKATYEFIPVPTRPFIQIEVVLTSGLSQTDQMVQAIKKHSLQDAIVKIIYHIPSGKKDLVDLKVIEQACQDALYVIGVIPIHSFEAREKRSCAFKVTMDLPELLDSYFATKPELQAKRSDLIEKTLILWQDHLDQQEEQS
ncbi:MAG TPA: exonuclease SbcCD subunit D [Candidatus Babeliales bacterium]|nr:exonuclease SbcCD subunit D [Candidatus Babeliales bacterium]